MSRQLEVGLAKLRKMNPKLECECLRAMSIINYGIGGLGESDEMRDLLMEGAVYTILRAHLGQRNIGSDMLRDQVSEKLFGQGPAEVA